MNLRFNQVKNENITKKKKKISKEILNIFDNINIIFGEKKIICDDGYSRNIYKLKHIKQKIFEKNLLRGGYKFKYKTVRCKILYLVNSNFDYQLYAYININVNNNDILKKLNLEYKVSYNDYFWIGFFIDGVNDLTLKDIFFINEQNLSNLDSFKLHTYGMKICMKIINNYLNIMK